MLEVPFCPLRVHPKIIDVIHEFVSCQHPRPQKKKVISTLALVFFFEKEPAGILPVHEKSNVKQNKRGSLNSCRRK